MYLKALASLIVFDENLPTTKTFIDLKSFSAIDALKNGKHFQIL